MSMVTPCITQKQLYFMERKCLRGPIVDAEVRAADEAKIDGLLESAVAGERVRSFVAVSSWFWSCFPCVQPNDAPEPDSRRDQ